jgi:hypothetical protein
MFTRCKKKIDMTSGRTPAYIFTVMLITIVVVMFPYIIFNDYVTSVFYTIAVNNGGDPALFNLIVSYWTTYYIVAFIFSLVIWAVVNSMRPEEMM